MAQETVKATLKSNGKQVEVYRSKLRNTFIDYSNCTTEYQESELSFS